MMFRIIWYRGGSRLPRNTSAGCGLFFAMREFVLLLTSVLFAAVGRLAAGGHGRLQPDGSDPVPRQFLEAIVQMYMHLSVATAKGAILHNKYLSAMTEEAITKLCGSLFEADGTGPAHDFCKCFQDLGVPCMPHYVARRALLSAHRFRSLEQLRCHDCCAS